MTRRDLFKTTIGGLVAGLFGVKLSKPKPKGVLGITPEMMKAITASMKGLFNPPRAYAEWMDKAMREPLGPWVPLNENPVPMPQYIGNESIVPVLRPQYTVLSGEDMYEYEAGADEEFRKIVAEAAKRMAEEIDRELWERMKGEQAEDRRFLSGAQWTKAEAQAYRRDGHTFVRYEFPT